MNRPSLRFTAKFVLVIVHSEGEFVEACMEAGSLGFVQASCMNRHLVPAVKAALAGQSCIYKFDSVPSRNPAAQEVIIRNLEIVIPKIGGSYAQG